VGWACHAPQDAALESQYIAAIKAHISYWFDNDVALFLVQRMLSVSLP
jgi:hypothetical protein